MAHPSDLQFHLDTGGTIASLGIQSMPEGYQLLRDSDHMYYTWMEESTGREGPVNWNKWAVRIGAFIDARREKNADG